MKRYKKVYTDGHAFALIFQQDKLIHGRVVTGIPSGSRCIKSDVSLAEGCLYMIFEHPSFDEVPEGADIPILYIQVDIEPTSYDKCSHSYKQYIGLNEVYEYCVKCQERK